MGESHEQPRNIRLSRFKKEAARVFLASVIATGIGEANSNEATAQSGPTPLEKYGRITLLNATRSEGGTIGQSNIVYDPRDEKNFMCTIEHVAQGGPLWRDAFDVEKSGGEDPIVCYEIEAGVPGGLKDAPEISTQEINQGDTISMPNEDAGTTDFVVTEVEENKVWFAPENPEEWTPGRGDSGTLVGSIEGENTYALGVYAGQSIVPNRENPDEPIVTYFMVPFESE